MILTIEVDHHRAMIADMAEAMTDMKGNITRLVVVMIDQDTMTITGAKEDMMTVVVAVLRILTDMPLQTVVMELLHQEDIDSLIFCHV
jgi:hypothetical protein